MFLYHQWLFGDGLVVGSRWVIKTLAGAARYSASTAVVSGAVILSTQVLAESVVCRTVVTIHVGVEWIINARAGSSINDCSADRRICAVDRFAGAASIHGATGGFVVKESAPVRILSVIRARVTVYVSIVRIINALVLAQQCFGHTRGLDSHKERKCVLLHLIY